jgi:hypothetical protein
VTSRAWLPDPTGKHDHRWWDGEQWTEHVADAGEAAVDPVPAGQELPPPSGPATDVAGGEQGGGQGDATGGRSTEQVWGQQDTGGGNPGWDQAAGGSSAAGQQPGPSGDQGAAWGQQAGPSGDQGAAWGQGGAGQQPPVWGQQQPGYGQQPWGQQPGAPGDPGASGWGQGGGQPPAWGQQPGPAGQPAWGSSAPVAGRNDGMALAALIIGILSLLIAWIPVVGILAAIGGLIALILGFVARGRIKRNATGGNGMAMTGIVTGAIALVVGIVLTVVFFSAFGAWFGDSFRDYAQCVEETGDEQRCTELLEEGLLERFSD